MVQAHNPLICIVDDDEGVRRSLKLMLRAAGHAVETFSDATTYLASGRTADTACLILDVHMPDMSGPDLQIRLIEDGHRTPIIFISGDAGDTLERRLISKGALCLLRKPVDSAVLVAAVATAFADR